jgi:hypothetical protein
MCCDDAERRGDILLSLKFNFQDLPRNYRRAAVSRRAGLVTRKCEKNLARFDDFKTNFF